MEELRAEIVKCDVVCSNCHRIRTMERKDAGKNADWDLRKAVAVALALPEPDELQMRLDLDAG